MMQTTIELKGFKELAEALRTLPDKLAGNTMKQAVSAGAQVIQAEMKNNASRMADTGTLARSIYRKFIPELSANYKVVYFVAPRQAYNYRTKIGDKRVKAGAKNDAYYARWVELGHWSRPSGGKAIKVRAGARGREAELNRLSAAGQIKWVGPHSFMRPAFDTQKERAIGALGLILELRLQRLDKIA